MTATTKPVTLEEAMAMVKALEWRWHDGWRNCSLGICGIRGSGRHDEDCALMLLLSRYREQAAAPPSVDIVPDRSPDAIGGHNAGRLKESAKLASKPVCGTCGGDPHWACHPMAVCGQGDDPCIAATNPCSECAHE